MNVGVSFLLKKSKFVNRSGARDVKGQVLRDSRHRRCYENGCAVVDESAGVVEGCLKQHRIVEVILFPCISYVGSCNPQPEQFRPNHLHLQIGAFEMKSYCAGVDKIIQSNDSTLYLSSVSIPNTKYASYLRTRREREREFYLGADENRIGAIDHRQRRGVCLPIHGA